MFEAAAAPLPGPAASSAELDALRAEIAFLHGKVSGQGAKIVDQGRMIASLEVSLAERDRAIAGRDSVIAELEVSLAERDDAIAAQRDEIAVLKNAGRRPRIKPSGMRKAAEGGGSGGEGKPRRPGRRGRKPVSPERRTVRVALERPPEGSRLKGLRGFLFQDVRVVAEETLYRREVWRTPDGRIVAAPLPDGVAGHFGAGVRRLVLALAHHCRVTVGRIVELLRGIGLSVSRRTVVRILNEGGGGFAAESCAVLEAGLRGSPWIAVDDAGIRHKARNAHCTAVASNRFAWFGTSLSKSRLNFLDILRNGRTGFAVNAEALAQMRRTGLPEGLVSAFASHPARRFADLAAWSGHLRSLGIDPGADGPGSRARLATEAAMWGCVRESGLLEGTAIASDDAGQFNVGDLHCLCWIHAERLVHKLSARSGWRRDLVERARSGVRELYFDLCACRDPTPDERAAFRRRFLEVFKPGAGFATLDRLLGRLGGNADELLRALELPGTPLHTNSAELDIRGKAAWRKVSGGTRSEAGREARDAHLGLMKTAEKNGIRFRDCLGDRLGVPGAKAVPDLPELVAAGLRADRARWGR